MDLESLHRALEEATKLMATGAVDQALMQMSELEASVNDPILEAHIWARYATLFAMIEMAGEARGAVIRALILDPKNARANYLEGVMLMADGDIDGATKALHLASTLYPSSDKYHLAEVYGNLAYCHQMNGDDMRAQMYWDMSEELDPAQAGDVLVDISPDQAPPPCSAVERVEELLRKMGALDEDDSLFDGDEVESESQISEDDDDYWVIPDEKPKKAAKSGAKHAAKKGKGRKRSR